MLLTKKLSYAMVASAALLVLLVVVASCSGDEVSVSPPAETPGGAELVGGGEISIANARVPVGSDVDEVIAGGNQFAFDFYRQIVASNPSDNQFFSPWSILTAFALLGEGARGETASEIWEAFGLSDLSDDARREALKAIADYINVPSDAYDLEVANAFWQRFPALAEYLENAETYYDAEIRELTDDATADTDAINDWASEKTRGLIDQVVTPEVVKEAVFLLANALYFKGTWVNQFDETLTENRPFWTGEAEVMAPLMSLYEEQFSYAALDGFQALELPYEGDRVSMLVLLPHDRNGIGELEASLDGDLLAKVRSELETTTVHITLPRFELKTNYDLIEHLAALGIESVFNDADLSGISDGDNLYVDRARQDAVVKVNEEGTEAAAVTIISTVTSVDLTPRFIANHPFIFLIQDDATGNILFMGKVTDPNKSE